MSEYGNPEAFLLLIPVWGLLLQRWVTGTNKLAVPGFGAIRRSWS